MSHGIVFLVGGGPGDPGLITVRGRKLIESADAIVYDALANRALLPADAKVTGHPELYDVGKRGGDKRSVPQDEINELLVRLARDGKRVVRLKGGDPFVFGRGSEEAQALNDASVPFEVVPGVTAGIAAAAYAGIPVTHRGIATSVTFVTGHEDPSKPATQTDWAALAKVGGTIVLYMGVKTLPAIAAALIKGGLPPEIPAVAVQWGTLSRQRSVAATLETLAEKASSAGITAPVITVIGWSAVLRDEINWFEHRPLFGKRIVVTRAAQQSQTLTDKLLELGADVIELPATRIARLDLGPLREEMTKIGAYQWLIFTSQNAVSIFWEQLLGSGRDARALAGLAIAAVGPATAGALLERGITVDVIPDRFVAEGLLKSLIERDDVTGARVLYITAEGARETLVDGLMERGAEVTVIRAYRSIQDGAGASKLKKALVTGSVHAVTFTSASSVRGYVDAVGEELSLKAPAVTIGPQTSEAAASAGIQLLAEAEESTIDGVVAAVERSFA